MIGNYNKNQITLIAKWFTAFYNLKLLDKSQVTWDESDTN